MVFFNRKSPLDKRVLAIKKTLRKKHGVKLTEHGEKYVSGLSEREDLIKPEQIIVHVLLNQATDHIINNDARMGPVMANMVVGDILEIIKYMDGIYHNDPKIALNNLESVLPHLAGLSGDSDKEPYEYAQIIWSTIYGKQPFTEFV